jgi:hypothetical protein
MLLLRFDANKPNARSRGKSALARYNTRRQFATRISGVENLAHLGIPVQEMFQ